MNDQPSFHWRRFQMAKAFDDAYNAEYRFRNLKALAVYHLDKAREFLGIPSIFL